MSRLWKLLIMLISIIFVINIIYSCVVDMFDLDGFESKEEVIIAIEENINDLNKLTKEIYYKLYKAEVSFVTIENKFIKKWHSSNVYRTKLSNKIFKVCKLNYIAIDYNEKRVRFSVKCKFGTYCGFYFSIDNNRNYEILSNKDIVEFKKYGSYFEFNDKTALINDVRHGWYTEKVCDNVYFFEQDFDNLNFIRYIYNDIVNMKPVNKYYQKNIKFFERYNPHNDATASIVR